MISRSLPIYFTLICFLCAPAYCAAQQTAQVRAGVEIKVELEEKVSLYFDEEYRYGSDDETNYVHTEIGLSYAALDWLDAGFYLRNIFEEQDDDWQYELRPRVEATAHQTWGHFGISSRNRIEARIMSQGNAYRYRNKAKFFFPFDVKSWNLSPYVADEIFVIINDGVFEQNRVYAGLDFKFARHAGMDIYYFWEYLRTVPNHRNKHVAGVKLKLSF